MSVLASTRGEDLGGVGHVQLDDDAHAVLVEVLGHLGGQRLGPVVEEGVVATTSSATRR